jgi:hypothetical protein
MGQRFGLVVGRGRRDGGYKFEFRINEALLPLVEFAVQRPSIRRRSPIPAPRLALGAG